MIVMVESGRLGNQIFQYLALRSVASPRERIVLLGFDQLRQTFDGVDASFVHIGSNPLRHLVSLDLSRLARKASHLPFVGTISEDEAAGARRQASARLALAEPAWFQGNGAHATPTSGRLHVRPHWLSIAQAFLDDRELGPHLTAVVHVRAGDYRSWPSAERPAILSPQWYRARIAEIRQAEPGLAVVAIGDDGDYTREVIQGIANAHHFTSDAPTAYAQEFALMTSCRFGILSASSFAYWGAYFARRRYPDGTFVGPRYWAGHGEEAWFPPHIEADFIEYR